MQTLEKVGYFKSDDKAAAPTSAIGAWLSDPQMSDSSFIQKLQKDLNLPLAGRSDLVLMCTEAGRLGVVEFLEKNGAWNPHMHGDQWQFRIKAAIESGHKAVIEHTAKRYNSEAQQGPFCVPIDKRALLIAILANQSPSQARVTIEAFGLKNVSLTADDVAIIPDAYNIKSERGQLVWRHQKSLHLTVLDNRSVAAYANCCDHSVMVTPDSQAYKGQFSNILVGYHGYKPADGKPRQLLLENFDGPYVLLGFVDKSRKLAVEFYLVGTGTFNEYSRTELKNRGHVIDAFSLLQIGAAACHTLVMKAVQAKKALRIDYQSENQQPQGCVHLMLPTYALVAVHTIESSEHAVFTAAGHGFTDKLKQMFGNKEEEKPKGEGKDVKPTQARHISILQELALQYPPKAVAT